MHTAGLSPVACGRRDGCLEDGAPADGHGASGLQTRPTQVLPPHRKPLPPRQEGVPHAGGSVVLPLPAFIRLLRIRLLLQEKSCETKVLVKTVLEVIPVWGPGLGPCRGPRW